MLTMIEFYCRPNGVLACVPSGAAPALATRFDQLVFSEDVRVSDESASTTEFLVVGAGAADTLASALALDASRLAGLTELSQVDWEDGFVARLGESVLPSFGVCAPVGRGPEIVSRLEAAGVVAMSDVMIESLRIQAGRPKWGVDMNEETIPLEAGLLERAISTSKGCYVGQEIIIRILHRGGGRVAKRLVTLQADPAGHGPAPRVPVTLSTEGRVVGSMTSSAPSPSGRGLIGLGNVQRDAAEIGHEFELGDGGGAHVKVTGFAS